MIWNYTPPNYESAKEYRSPFERGHAVLFLYFGHGEYGMPKHDKLDIKVWSRTDEQYHEPDWITPDIRWHLQEHNPIFHEVFADDCAWADVIRLEGPVHALWQVYYEFANQLDPQQDPADYTPGGDDDTFDYYPSAFECMQMFAYDLDEMDQLYAGSGNPRRRFLARHRIVEIVRNLYHAKGEFTEWEFEDHAAPYLADIGLQPKE